MPTTGQISSPLRYPGGKARISTFLVDILLINNLEGCKFFELYAGGAGAALSLLFSKVVNSIVINDLDPHIYKFWKCIVEDTDSFLKKMYDTPVNISSWDLQREIYKNEEKYSELDVAFSTFFLNRSNRSGILYKAGPIGGRDQSGNYKIDVRFNKKSLEQRILKIARFADKIEVRNEEAITLIKKVFRQRTNDFIFLDPPYYDQGENLYLNFYTHEDHIKLRDILKKNNDKKWFLTYDNCEEINELYTDFKKSNLPMSYTLQAKRKSKEVMMFSGGLYLPKTLRLGSKFSPLVLK